MMKYISSILLLLCSLSISAQQLIPGFPQANGQVHTLHIAGDILYFGGNFTMVDGQPRQNAAAYDLLNQQLLPWAPNPDDAVVSIVTENGVAYIAGSFQMVDGQSRNNLAATDAATGAVTAWSPTINFPGIPGMQTGTITSLDATKDTLYIGGYFIDVNGQPYANVAALNTTDGTPYPWDANPNIPVSWVRVNGSDVYVAGPFSSIGGASRDGIAKIDRITANAQPWDPQPNNPGNEWGDILFHAGSVYLSGPFTQVGGAAVNLCAKLNGSATADPAFNAGFTFNPANYEPVRALAAFNGRVLAGGDFVGVQGTHNYLVSLSADSAVASPWMPNLNNRVRDIATYGGIFIAAGDFTMENGAPRVGLAAYEVIASATDPARELPSVMVYPNPVRGLARVESELAIRSLRLQDLSGKSIAISPQIEGGRRAEFSVEGMPAGMYILVIETAKGAVPVKLWVK